MPIISWRHCSSSLSSGSRTMSFGRNTPATMACLPRMLELPVSGPEYFSSNFGFQIQLRGKKKWTCSYATLQYRYSPPNKFLWSKTCLIIRSWLRKKEFSWLVILLTSLHPWTWQQPWSWRFVSHDPLVQGTGTTTIWSKYSSLIYDTLIFKNMKNILLYYSVLHLHYFL